MHDFLEPVTLLNRSATLGGIVPAHPVVGSGAARAVHDILEQIVLQQTDFNLVVARDAVGIRAKFNAVS